ncbi:SDR family NAD(P)-dependent oxidoreductase [Aliarcobacter butzleri]|uniref:SDR family NAD(P)-dependent oxidoreductase n=1 Tax=Aliarcobacter butzleri TaxID=28197 RepID=UPI0021B40656|nr:SDR family oxidoreductase [Aliarcobacter butzleri]MCT7649178.1 SDR family oxidoreductase [Aliarcobacter butzleri]
MKNVALITGASSGIGKELAKIHAKKGGDLVLIARNEDSLISLKNDLELKFSVKVVNIIIDLSVIGAAKEVYEKVKALNIEIEYLFNNAGFGLLGKFDELSWERQSQMINLNIIAVTELTYLFLSDMKKRNSGKILNTSSTASLLPGPLQAVYYATKAYITSWGNALSEELRDTNITVTNLLPGATETNFGTTSGMDKTKVFAKPVSALSVAQDGYNAMIKGEVDKISGLNCFQNMMIKIIPFVPKKMLLKNVRQLQEVK